uniref:Uncharacterized protein n=1 Tax=Glossina pallidipes TaxID=7398 RepID=A0A1A9ZVA4_GLOPL
MQKEGLTDISTSYLEFFDWEYNQIIYSLLDLKSSLFCSRQKIAKEFLVVIYMNTLDFTIIFALGTLWFDGVSTFGILYRIKPTSYPGTSDSNFGYVRDPEHLYEISYEPIEKSIK